MVERGFFLRSFFVIALIATVMFYAASYYIAHNTSDYKLKERLIELGYPKSGYYFADNSIRYPDGRVIVFEDGKVENYTVNIYQATSAASSLLSPYQTKLAPYGYSLVLEYDKFSETKIGGDLYFVFPIDVEKGGHLGSGNKMLAGYVYVDRKNGIAFIKGILG